MKTGACIKARREMQGMTQLELAKRVGLRHNSTISMYEAGLRQIDADRLPEFAAALGCGVAELLGLTASEEGNKDAVLQCVQPGNSCVRTV